MLQSFEQKKIHLSIKKGLTVLIPFQSNFKDHFILLIIDCFFLLTTTNNDERDVEEFSLFSLTIIVCFHSIIFYLTFFPSSFRVVPFTWLSCDYKKECTIDILPKKINFILCVCDVSWNNLWIYVATMLLPTCEKFLWFCIGNSSKSQLTAHRIFFSLSLSHVNYWLFVISFISAEFFFLQQFYCFIALVINSFFVCSFNLPEKVILCLRLWLAGPFNRPS